MQQPEADLLWSYRKRILNRYHLDDLYSPPVFRVTFLQKKHSLLRALDRYPFENNMNLAAYMTAIGEHFSVDTNIFTNSNQSMRQDLLSFMNMTFLVDLGGGGAFGSFFLPRGAYHMPMDFGEESRVYAHCSHFMTRAWPKDISADAFTEQLYALISVAKLQWSKKIFKR